MSKETIELISSWVTIIGFPITFGTIFIVMRQFAHSKNIEEAKFWLELRQIFLIHNDVHLKLRNGGLWTINNAGPETLEDLVKVEAYLGQFELCQSMLERKLISKDIFESQYRYRLENINNNALIVTIIRNTAEDWVGFIRLCKTFEIGDWPG